MAGKAGKIEINNFRFNRYFCGSVKVKNYESTFE